MKCYFNGTDYVIAKDTEDAWDVWEEEIGEKRKDYEDDMSWKEASLDGIMLYDDDEETGWDIATVECWVEKFGRGYIGNNE